MPHLIPLLASVALAAIIPHAPETGRNLGRVFGPDCGPDDLVSTQFAVTWHTFPGTSIFVIGDGEHLGSWDPLAAVKLEPGSYPAWRAEIGLPAGEVLSFKYAARRDSPEELEDPENIELEGGALRWVAVEGERPSGERRLYYHSGWTEPTVLWRSGGGPDWEEELPLERQGPGRAPGEWLYAVDGVGRVCAEVEWIFTDGASGRDYAPGGVPYRSRVPRALVQDGAVYDYSPAASVTPSRIEIHPDFDSVFLPDDRDIRVYLPRGYDDHPWRAYPVLYMHDGQNIFFPGGPFGCWYAEETADEEIGHARMRETIVVGIDNTAARLWEYMPPEDGGLGDLYLRLLGEELKPYIDATYRTRPGAEDTGVLGSSLGGLISLYIGWERPELFGRVGAMSPSLWLDSLVERVELEPRREGRYWLDSGTAGPSNDSMWDTYNARDGMLRNGYVLGADLEHFLDLGAMHNEAAWAARLWRPFDYLLPGSDGSNGFYGPQAVVAPVPLRGLLP